MSDAAAYERMLDTIAKSFEAKDFTRAANVALDAVQSCQKLHGADHPEVVSPLYALAAARTAQQAPLEASEAALRALALATRHPKASEPSSDVIAQLLDQLATQLPQRWHRRRRG